MLSLLVKMLKLVVTSMYTVSKKVAHYM